MPNYNPDFDVNSLGRWEAPDSEPAFSEGDYIFILGGIYPVHGEGSDTSQPPDAILNDLWVLKYVGPPDKTLNQTRVTIKDGVANLAPKGARMVERYPNPAQFPKIAWRAGAFFSHFDCMEEVDTGKKDPDGKAIMKKFVDWKKVKLAYGTIFRASVVYRQGKEGKNYRNLDYESITLANQKVSPSDMKLIEDAYKAMREEKDVTSGAEAPPGVSDLPF